MGELVLMLQAMTIALPSWIFHVGTLNLPPAFIHIFDFVLASNVNHWVPWMLIILPDNLIVWQRSDTVRF